MVQLGNFKEALELAERHNFLEGRVRHEARTTYAYKF